MLEEDLYEKENAENIDSRSLRFIDFVPLVGTPAYLARNLFNRGLKFYINFGIIRSAQAFPSVIGLIYILK